MDTSGRRRALAVGALLMPLLAGCDPDPVTPEPLVDAPAYAAEVGRSVVVRSGDQRVRLDRADEVRWLSEEAVLVAEARSYRVLDLTTGDLSRRLHRWAWVGSGPGLVTVLTDRALTTYDTDLRQVDRIPLPGIDVEDLARGYYGEVAVMPEATFVQWSDANPDGEDVPEGERGLLRIADGETSEVLGGRIVDLLPTPDGLALLAVRQVTGEDCGGCIVPQEVVELDPGTGEVVEELGMPDAYTDEWRVRAVDKVGDRVAVRFEGTNGTWVHDDGWSLVEGSEAVATWWQGADDRIEVDPDGRLAWVTEQGEEALPGTAVTVPGRLLPPA